MSNEVQQCPWCQRWFLKDISCNYIFACGLEPSGVFKAKYGCGKSWCWQCGKKFCGHYYDEHTAIKLPTAKDNHDAECCKKEPGFKQEDYCPGGHNSHCEKRW